MVFIEIFIIAVISIFWAMLSLRDLKNSKIIKDAKKELSRGRVVFRRK